MRERSSAIHVPNSMAFHSIDDRWTENTCIALRRNFNELKKLKKKPNSPTNSETDVHRINDYRPKFKCVMA